MPPSPPALARKARHRPVFPLPVLPMQTAWVARSLHPNEAHMRKPTATAPSVPLGRKMNPSKTTPPTKTSSPAKTNSPVKASPAAETSPPAKANPPAPPPKPAVTAVEIGARHMRKPAKKAPSAKRGRKLKPSKSSPPEKTSPPAKTNPPAKTSSPAPQPKPAVTAVELGARHREISAAEFFTKHRHLLR